MFRNQQSAWLLSLFLWVPPLAFAQETLPDTQPLAQNGDFGSLMVEGIHVFLDHKTEQAAAHRDTLWVGSNQAIDPTFLASSRERLRKLIGAVDARLPVKALEWVATTDEPAQIASGEQYKIFRVRWPVFEGVYGEGLLLRPEGRPAARIVAIPDADWSPEMLAGLTPGVTAAAQYPRRLAEAGCEVVVPVLIDRHDTWSGIPGIRMTNQPHREFIYRMAFEVGRHIIGYEVQKILAVVDWFDHEDREADSPLIGVIGYGEGGLLALHAAALDSRIKRTVVSGYFQSRDAVWQEPVYRDVWGLLNEHGDAELARLIDRNFLIVEASAGPEVDGPPPETEERRGATPNGRLTTPALASTRRELERVQSSRWALIGDGTGLPGSVECLEALLKGTSYRSAAFDKAGSVPVASIRAATQDTFIVSREKRQFDELVDFTQRLVRQSPKRREEFWASTDSSSVERWQATTHDLRNRFWSDVIGRLPEPSMPVNPRSRPIFDRPKFRGYEVMIDVWPDVFAYGILLVPKDLQPGERRPVVVCQHGLEGRPTDVADPDVENRYYHRYAVRLAEEGFVTFAPQNPYIGKDRFRLIQRKAHPLKLSLFSFILGQHQRLLEWLSGLSFVDPHRIGFYGLSYGGKTAMRIPPLLEQYALSICSADFNEWVWKTTSNESRYSYLLTNEYDMVEFNLANVANYAELGNLMAPRPFMVERGHGDGVAPDEWVAYEYAKIRNFYDTQMKLPDRTRIEFFDGPHTINGKGTFEFLRTQLHWPGE